MNFFSRAGHSISAAFFKSKVPAAPQGTEYPENVFGVARETYLLSQPDRNNPSKIAQNEGLNYFWQKFLDHLQPYLRSRDPSYLWVTANGLTADEDRAKHRAQLLPASHDSQDMEIWQFCADVLDYQIRRGFRQVLKQTFYGGKIFNYAVQEILWEEYEGRMGIGDIVDRDPDMFVLNPVNREPGLYRREQWYSSTLTRCSDRKFLLYTPLYLLENPYGVGEIDEAIKTAYKKEQVEFFMLRHLEKAGTSPIFGRYPDDKDSALSQHKEWRSALLSMLSNMRNAGVGIIPKSVELDVLNNQGLASLFLDVLNYYDKRQAILWTRNLLTFEPGTTGSNAQAQTTQAVGKSEDEMDDVHGLQEVYNTVIRWLVDWNWPDVKRYPRLQIIDPRSIKPIMPEVKGGPVPSKEQSMPDEQESLEVPHEPVETEMPPEEPEIETFARTVGFPINAKNPKIFQQAEIQERARQYLAHQAIMMPKDFDRLPESEKQQAFTITRLGVLNDLNIIKRLHAEITKTMPYPTEAQAWDAYLKQAQAILKRSNAMASIKDLAVSFRMARQEAFMHAIYGYAQENQTTMHGIQYKTLDDVNVRTNHRKMHNVTRPVDDPVFTTWMPPNGFGCRCYLLPVTKAMFEATPKKYAYTQKIPNVLPDKGFVNV